MTREPPKRGAKCDSCGAAAQGLYYRWHACDKCASEAAEVSARWNVERRALEVV